MGVPSHLTEIITKIFYKHNNNTAILTNIFISIQSSNYIIIDSQTYLPLYIHWIIYLTKRYKTYRRKIIYKIYFFFHLDYTFILYHLTTSFLHFLSEHVPLYIYIYLFIHVCVCKNSFYNSTIWIVDRCATQARA